MNTVLKIALGIILGFGFLWIVRSIYIGYAVQTALESFNQNMQATANRENARQIALAREKTKQKELELAYKQRQLAAAQAKEEERRRMEAAWSRYYQKPARCERPKPEDLVECGNDHIRARRAFEKQWALAIGSDSR